MSAVHTCVIQLDHANNALKLTYGDVEYKKFSQARNYLTDPRLQRDAATRQGVPRLTRAVERGGGTDGREGKDGSTSFVIK